MADKKITLNRFPLFGLFAYRAARHMDCLPPHLMSRSRFGGLGKRAVGGGCRRCSWFGVPGSADRCSIPDDKTTPVASATGLSQASGPGLLTPPLPVKKQEYEPRKKSHRNWYQSPTNL
jgi:hypothetical protein